VTEAERPSIGIVAAYGIRWRRDYYRSSRRQYQLLGRIGHGRATKAVDFSGQDGLYVLYLGDGVTYVGIAVHQSLEDRLRVHTRDKYKALWDQFSWFGFREPVHQTETNGYHVLSVGEPYLAAVRPKHAIMDLEGVLHRIYGQTPTAPIRGKRWNQVEPADVDRILKRAKQRPLRTGRS
jgi:hypothetical protein